MEIDENKIDDAVLALLHLTSSVDHGVARAWKGHDWDALNRLHDKGLISDPRNKAKSVILSDEGAKRSKELFERLAGRKGVWVDRTREAFLKKWKETRSLSDRYQSIKALRGASHGVLFASTEEKASERLRALRQSRKYPVGERRKVVEFLQRHWERLMMHHRVRGLPRTINLIENVNKQLERRFKTIEGFQHRSTAIGYVNLLIAYLRYKPYTDCRGKRKYLNGQSRLEAAGVQHDRTSWIRQCLKSA